MEEAVKPRRDAFDIFYVRLIRSCLNTIGQWPNTAFGDLSRWARFLRFYNCFVIFNGIASGILVVWYLVKYNSTIIFIDKAQIYTNILLNAMSIQRSTLPFQKKFVDVVKKFVLEFHLLHHEDISAYAVKEARWINRICDVMSKIIVVQIFFGIISYNIFPLLMNVSSGMLSSNKPDDKRFITSVDYVLPFDYQRDLTGYIIVFIYNWYPSINIPSAMCFYDLLLLTMVIHIAGHLNILSRSLKDFPLPEGNYENGEKTSQEYNDQAFIELKKLIRQYQTIYHFMKELSQAYDFTLCCYLGFQQLMCILLLLECSTMDRDAVGKFGILTLFIFQQVIQTSVIFEQIHTKSDKLGDQVYGMPWEHMDVKNRKVMLLLLNNVQPPLGLKAGDMIVVGVRTMSSILKTAISYFLFLKSFG